jgi:hypothetical protein
VNLRRHAVCVDDLNAGGLKSPGDLRDDPGAEVDAAEAAECRQRANLEAAGPPLGEQPAIFRRREHRRHAVTVEPFGQQFDYPLGAARIGRGGYECDAPASGACGHRYPG